MKLPQCQKLSAAKDREGWRPRGEEMPLRLLEKSLGKWRDLS
jgi:hypothetical protein